MNLLLYVNNTNVLISVYKIMEYYHQFGLLCQSITMILYNIKCCYSILSLNANIMLKCNKIKISIIKMFK